MDALAYEFRAALEHVMGRKNKLKPLRLEPRTTPNCVDAIYRFDDITSTQFGVVLGSNRDGFNLFLRTHNMFERRPELVGKASMGHKH